jgi:hypothetical protein
MTDLNALSKEQLVALVAQMQAQPARKLSCKVSAKGALSVYGLGQFPVTLYRSQWERLLDDGSVVNIKAFITANDTLLAVKA